MQRVWAHWYAVHWHTAAALHSYTHPTWLRFWGSSGSGSHVESKWCHYVMVEAASHLKLLPTSISHMYKVFEHIDMLCPLAYSSSLTQFHPHYLAQILRFLWVNCGGKMMSLHDGWGWGPSQATSCIHMRHIQSVWAHWYAVHWHTAAALLSYTHPTWLRFGGSGSLVEAKWCHYVMVEAEGHLKLLPPSTLDIYKGFEHIDMLSMIGIQQQPYTVILILLGSDLGVLGHLWRLNDVIMSWLRLTAISNCFPHPYHMYTTCLSTLICCQLAYISSLTQFYPHYLAQILRFLWVTCGGKMMSLHDGWSWGPSQTASCIHMRHMQSVWAHWYTVHWHTAAALHSFIHPIWLRFGGSGSLVGSKWCHYVMVEAEGHLKLLSTSTLDLQSVWAHCYAWYCCCRHCAGVFAVVAQASSLLLSWHHALALSPSLCWPCQPSCQCDWPLNWREGPSLCTRIGSWLLPLPSCLCTTSL